MRWFSPVLALVLLLAAPALAQQTETVDRDEAFALQPDAYRALALTALAGDDYWVNVTADVPIDVLFVSGNVDAFYAAGGNYPLRLVGLNATHLSGNGTFETEGPWSLVLDNTNRTLAEGASGNHMANLTVHVTLRRTTTVVAPTPAGDGGTHNPWPVLMLTAPHWDLALLGLGGMGLWFVILAAGASVHYRAGWTKVAVLAVGSGLLLTGWLLLPRPGPISQIGFPLLVAFGVGWLGLRGATDIRQQLRLAFLGAGLGAILATGLAFLLQLIWTDPGFLVVGGQRFVDPVFILPTAASLAVLAGALITAFVEAFDEDAPPQAVEPTGLSTAFTVQCLRCATSIKVDRSMRRFRMATDRYEFACPNCQTWMEWAEPQPQASH